MLIRDHINLTGRHPLMGPNDDRLGPRFPDMSTVWDVELRADLRKAARARASTSPRASTSGSRGRPTRRRRRCACWASLGADAVGMSTVMEAIAAHWAGMRVCGVSLVTNAGAGLSADATHPRGGPGGGGRGRPQAGAGHRPFRGGPRLARHGGLTARTGSLCGATGTAPAARSGPYSVGSSRPAARAAAFFSAQAVRTLSLWGRMGQCSSRLRSSSQ